MRVGILTYHRSQNYGALWQAYALKTFLADKGYDVAVIDYWPEYHRKMYERRFIRRSELRRSKSKLSFLFNACRLYLWHLLRKNRTDAFVKNHMRLSKSRDYDVCVYGSDQIWRKQHQKECESFNPVYFGNDYVRASVKVSYAASMGCIEIDTQEDKEFITTSLTQFKSISVREEDLQTALSPYTDKPIEITSDPVFLLSQAQWSRILSKKFTPKGKYIFYYNLEEYPIADEVVRRLSTKYNMPIVEVRGYVRDKKNSFCRTQTASPIAFISLLHDAEYVVTSAFHGVALSLCFNKQFYYAAPDELAGRAQHLLEIFNLENRRIRDISTVKGDGIDYSKVNPLIEDYRTLSQNWLLSSIKG